MAATGLSDLRLEATLDAVEAAGREGEIHVCGQSMPAQVENLISDIDGVTGVAVIGIPDDRWGEVPWAVVTVRDGAPVDTDTVRAHLEGRLARYKMPKHVVVVDELPRTASGKVRKADLLDYMRGAVKSFST